MQNSKKILLFNSIETNNFVIYCLPNGTKVIFKASTQFDTNENNLIPNNQMLFSKDFEKQKDSLN